MRFKKLFLALLAAISVTVVAISVSGIGVGNFHIPLLHAVSRNSISGIEGRDGPVLVVKIDDTSFARPQVGIEEADLVYIEQVEGGLTRLAAVFSRQIPNLIGPVRSARITDVDLLSQYGFIAFAYSGAQSKLRPVLAAANWKDVGAEKLGSQFFFNDPLRNPPYAMMMRARDVMSSLQSLNVPIAISRNMGWSFGSAPDSGTSISQVRMRWPAASYEATWSQDDKRWLLSANGQPDFAASGARLGATTLVIQNVLITPSEYHDKVGGVTPLSHVIGSGTGYILRDGKYFPARWVRESANSGTRWSDSEGKEIHFAPGQIWVALTDQPPLFTPDSAARG